MAHKTSLEMMIKIFQCTSFFAYFMLPSALFYDGLGFCIICWLTEIEKSPAKTWIDKIKAPRFVYP